MNDMAELMDRLAAGEGVSTTFIDGVRIYKSSQNQPRQPLVYEQGVVIVGQGKKRIYLGGQVYEYRQDNYLVLTVPLPAECEAQASRDEPILLMTLDFNMAQLNRIIAEMDDGFEPPDHTHDEHGLFVSHMTCGIRDAAIRLLQILQSSLDSRVLGRGVVHELLYRIMCGEHGSLLYDLTVKNTNLARIGRALKVIHQQFNEPMDVERLSGIVNMSSSGFHRAFKEVTASSPIQYIKKVRLEKARSLLLEGKLRVNEAASEVGYESPTQFSREFKRHFGESPVKYAAVQSRG